MERHKMQFTLEKEKVYGSYNGRNHLSNSGCNRSSFNFHTADRKKKIIKKSIVIADLTNIDDTICKYFVICQGNSPSQVIAIVDSIKEFTRKGAGTKPSAIDGQRNAEWVAMDFSDVLVHVFLPEARNFYNLEHLWADAKLTTIPDID